MNIKTRFNIGDVVHLINSDTPILGEVFHIEVLVDKTGEITIRNLVRGIDGAILCRQRNIDWTVKGDLELFKTRKELAAFVLGENNGTI